MFRHIFLSVSTVKSQSAVGFYCFIATCWKPPDGNKGECSRARILCSGKQNTWTELKKKQKVIMEGWGGGRGDQVNNFRKTAVQDAEKVDPGSQMCKKGEQEQEMRKCSKEGGSISFETNDNYSDWGKRLSHPKNESTFSNCLMAPWFDQVRCCWPLMLIYSLQRLSLYVIY